MAVQGQRLEPGIVYFQFGQHLSLQDIVDAVNETARISKETGDAQIVIISNFESGARIPFDLHNIKKLAISQANIVASITIGAPMMTQIFGRLLERVTTLAYIDVESQEEALQAARRILAGEPVH